MSGKKTRACLVVNARSQRSHFDLDDALVVLLDQGWEVDVREKKAKGDARRIARKAAKDGVDLVVSCGGDGTLNEIVDGLVGSDVAVGTIPGGTENVWSRQVGIDQRSRVAATQLAAGQWVKVDIGRVSFGDKHAAHFLMMAGLGADGAVMQRVSRSVKNRLGPLAVGLAAVEALPSLTRVEAAIEMDGTRWSGAISEMVVGNIRDYGGFTQVTNRAYVDDGLLDVCIFTTDGLLPAARQMASLVFRRQPSESSSETYRAACITVRAARRLPLQVDGSDLKQGKTDGAAEYRFSVVRRALTVVLPATYDGAIFERGLDLNGSRHLKKKSSKSRGNRA
jgi:YegS/Rv2252/BmrU family lipid kinase